MLWAGGVPRHRPALQAGGRHRPAAAGPGAVHHSRQAPAHPRLLLDEERSTLLNLPHAAPAQATSPVRPAPPSGQAGWRIVALGVLAAVLALVAGVAVMAARRAHRSQRAGQTA